MTSTSNSFNYSNFKKIIQLFEAKTVSINYICQLNLTKLDICKSFAYSFELQKEIVCDS